MISLSINKIIVGSLLDEYVGQKCSLKKNPCLHETRLAGASESVDLYPPRIPLSVSLFCILAYGFSVS